jgi:hypothetical protein
MGTSFKAKWLLLHKNKARCLYVTEKVTTVRGFPECRRAAAERDGFYAAQGEEANRHAAIKAAALIRQSFGRPG